MKRIILFLLLPYSFLQAANIGSDTAVTRFNTQQIVQNGDRIAGFAALAGGFALSGNGSIGTFDSFFSVSGDIALNFGTLILSQDLIINNITAINTLGNIIGNNHIMEFAPFISCVPN